MPSNRKTLEDLAITYAQSEGIYRDFAACIRDLMIQIIAKHGITVHSVTSRGKTRESLKGKIEKAGKSYSSLNDITDLAGVRIITHFTDDAETIANLIEAEFDIDTKNTVDKRRLLEPNEFGYLSIHHVACLHERRSALAEYSRFKGLKVEIQTRSILQHAWAEIEHDLGYKSTTAVPRKLRRRISRLAGLLELADQEFQTVRDEIENYERDLPQLVLNKPRTVEIDKSSLDVYVKLNDLPKTIDQQIADACNSYLTEDASVDYALIRLNWLGITNIAEISDHLSALKETIICFAIDFLGASDSKDKSMLRGMSLFYLAYVLIAQRSPQEIEQFFLDATNIGDSRDTKKFVKMITETYSKAMANSIAVSRKETNRLSVKSSKPSIRRR